MAAKDEFNKALSNFTTEVACKGAINHLADLGKNVTEIAEQLNFPTPLEKIASIVWQHYIDTGVIYLDNPQEAPLKKKYKFVREYGEFGTASFKRVEEDGTLTGEEDRNYVLVDFGKRLYEDRRKFSEALLDLSAKDRDYVLSLPWPIKPVYHLADDRIMRIIDTLQESE